MFVFWSVGALVLRNFGALVRSCFCALVLVMVLVLVFVVFAFVFVSVLIIVFVFVCVWWIGVLVSLCFGVLSFWRFRVGAVVFGRTCVLVCWGLFSCWCLGVLVFWCFGVLVCWCAGVLILTCFGVLKC